MNRILCVAFTSLYSVAAPVDAFTDDSTSSQPPNRVAECNQHTPRRTSARLGDRSIIFVDDDNTEGPWDGSVDYPYQYIQDGIDAAMPGDTVWVRDGTYCENIIVDREVFLTVSLSETALIVGDGFGDVVTITADNACISGFMITGTGDVPGDAGVQVQARYCAVQYNGFFDNKNAIRLYDAQDNAINQNVIFGCGVWCAIGLSNSSYNTISGNTICHGRWSAIWLDNGSSHNSVVDNTVFDNDFFGVELEDLATDNVVSGNLICDSRNAFSVWDAPSNTITSNQMLDNEFNHMRIWDSASLTIVDNTFTSGGGLDFDAYLLEDLTTHTISGNTVAGAPIYYYAERDDVSAPEDAAQVIFAACDNCNVSGLNMQDASSPIQMWYCTDSVVSNNTIRIAWYSDGIILRDCSNMNVVDNDIRSTYDKYDDQPSNNIAAINIEDGMDDTYQGNVIRGFNQGILIRHWNESSNNVISENDIASKLIGVWLIQHGGTGSGTIVTNNVFADSTLGAVYLAYWPEVTITGNQMTNCGVYINAEEPAHWNSHTVEANAVNDLPLLYYVGQDNPTLSSDSGQIILAECSNVEIDGLQISNASCAIAGGYCTNVAVRNCVLQDNHNTAVYFDQSSPVLAANNHIEGGGIGIQIGGCARCDIVENGLRGCGENGINVDHADNGLIADNVVIGGGSVGVYCWRSSMLEVAGNSIACSASTGLSMSECVGAHVHGNAMSGSGTYGLVLHSNCTQNMIVGNEFVDNHWSAKECYDSENNIWSGSAGGNYWSDFAENPGYPDYYEIYGDGGGVDFSPLDDVFRCPFAAGDIDGSCGAVDFADFELLAHDWDNEGNPSNEYGCSDLNNDGNIDMHDFLVFSREYGRE